MCRSSSPLVSRRITRTAVLTAIALAFATAPAASAFPIPNPELVKVTKGRVSLDIPKDWRETSLPGAKDLLGLWSADGKGLFSTSAFIALTRVEAKDINTDSKAYAILSDKEITVGGQATRRLLVEIKGDGGGGALPAIAKGKAIGLIVKKPDADGKHLVFIFAAAPDRWEQLTPLFEKIIESITIDGVGGTAKAGTGPFVTALYLDKGVEKPLEGATVVVGRRLHLIPFASVPSGEFWEDVLSRAPPGPRSGSIDLLCGEAQFLTGGTGANGVFSPNLPPGTYDIVVWKAGHIPQMNARVTIPGGGFKAYLTPDNQVGSTDRHRTLDTSRVFRMDPPNPGKPVVWGRVTLGNRTSPSPMPSPAASEDVTIVVGENLSFIRKEDPRSPGTFTDVVQGDMIYAEVKTNRDGTYSIPMPLGSITGGIFWTTGGALAGIIAGFGTSRRAGFTGAVLGMWVGGILGGMMNNATYQSAMSGILVWAAIGAPIGAIAGQFLCQATLDRPFRGAMGIAAGMLVMALGGVWLVVKLGGENNPALLAAWASVPVLTGLVGCLLPISRQPVTQAEPEWTTG